MCKLTKNKLILLHLAVLVIIAGVFIGIVLLYNQKIQDIKSAQQRECPETAVELGGSFFAIEPFDWQNPEKPQQSGILEQGEISAEAIRLQVSAKGFLPDAFEVKAGEKVVLVVSNDDKDQIHIFKFENPDLERVNIGLGGSETRGIVFYAPQRTGEYVFYCDIPGHKERGEIGKMVIK